MAMLGGSASEVKYESLKKVIVATAKKLRN